MAQQGFVFRKGDSWFLRYRHDVDVDGVIVRKQKCEKLADYCDRYRSKGDLDELVQEKMAKVSARETATRFAAAALFERTRLKGVLRILKI